MAGDERNAKQLKKEEARRTKRKIIADAGGVRPRNKKERFRDTDDSSGRRGHGNGGRKGAFDKTSSRHNSKSQRHGGHRFGRVMEQVPCPNAPRTFTLSIAVPGSVVSNAQTRELRTHLVGQIARACAVFHVDEIVVFDDKLANDIKGSGFKGVSRDNKRGWRPRSEDRSEDRNEEGKERRQGDAFARSDPHEFMARVLQYCECPQYLKTHFFPIHPDLKFAGLIPPLDAPHHARAWEKCKYREGVVLDKRGSGPGAGSLVDCGVRKKIE